MSFCRALYAGDPKQIAAAFVEAEQMEGESFVLAHANLPGVVPDASGDLANSPDLLTQLACGVVGGEAFTFADSIAEHLAGDLDPSQATDGAYAPAWSRLFATLTDPQMRQVAMMWLKELDPGAADAPDRVSETQALLAAIRSVCRVAEQQRCSVVYTWMM